MASQHPMCPSESGCICKEASIRMNLVRRMTYHCLDMYSRYVLRLCSIYLKVQIKNTAISAMRCSIFIATLPPNELYT